MFWNRNKDIDSTKKPCSVMDTEQLNRINTKQLAEVQAQISVIEPMAKRMLSEKVTFIGREELRPCYLLADLKRDEATLLFDIDRYVNSKTPGMKPLKRS